MAGMRRSSRCSTLSLPGLCVLILGACAAQPAPTPTPDTVGFRYLVDAVTMHGNGVEVPMLYLPDRGLVSEILSEFNPAPDDPFRMRYLARSFADAAGRHEQLVQDKPTERFELPSDVVEQLVALERLTARQRSLAEQVGTRLVQLVPLDQGYEFDCLLHELAAARHRSIDAARLDEIERRKERIRDGTVTDNCVDRLHRLREELAALVAGSQ